MVQRYRGRLAPSPTGAQHIGNARTYLIAWLAARKVNGELLLRMEDIDSPRIKHGAAEQALDDLRWLGLDWDGEVVVQSQRKKLYRVAFEELKKREHIYPCICSRSDVLAAASAPHAGDEGPTYPRTCAHRSAVDIPDQPHCWRFRVDHSPVFTDDFAGEQKIDLLAAVGDFVVWKNDDTPAYQLAVVVDDAKMGITHVVRGNDLIPSTPRQILLDDALYFDHRQYTHLPLVVGPDGKRLAKRHGDTRLSTLRQQGMQPEQLLGLLAFSCGWLEKPTPITAKECLSMFDMSRIPPQPFVYTTS